MQERAGRSTRAITIVTLNLSNLLLHVYFLLDEYLPVQSNCWTKPAVGLLMPRHFR
jgi:hypothetical protein